MFQDKIEKWKEKFNNEVKLRIEAERRDALSLQRIEQLEFHSKADLARANESIIQYKESHAVENDQKLKYQKEISHLHVLNQV